MHSRWWWMLTLAAALLAGGCASDGGWGFMGPGTIQQQRIRATVHDPYSDPNMAPEVVGGRPREYQEPLPEPVRNRIFVDSWWGR
jgi:hypothetical protein